MNLKHTSALAPSPARPTPRQKFPSCRLAAPRRSSTAKGLMAVLRAEGYELSKVHRDAAAVIVNTCGFLDNAKTETLAASARLGSLSSIEPRSA
jgi:ribosomal protein S12 methylthiotransferase